MIDEFKIMPNIEKGNEKGNVLWKKRDKTAKNKINKNT